MFLVGRMENKRDEKFICLVVKKNERKENKAGINLLICLYYIIYKKLKKLSSLNFKKKKKNHCFI